MRPTSVLTISILSLLLVACGGGGEEPAARVSEGGGATASSSSSEPRPSATEDATEEGTREAASTADADPCAEAHFDETATFAFHDELPFQFDYPAGWDHLARSNPEQLHGSLAHVGNTGRRSSTGSIQYVYALEATDSPEVMNRVFARSLEVVATLTVGGREIDVYGHPNRSAVSAKFLYPDDDGWHITNLIFGAASAHCVPERRRIRELVLSTISSRD